MLPNETGLHFQMVTTLLPDENAVATEEDERLETRRALDRLHRALDESGTETPWPVVRQQRKNLAAA